MGARGNTTGGFCRRFVAKAAEDKSADPAPEA
jgi:hypothetical protein